MANTVVLPGRAMRYEKYFIEEMIFILEKELDSYIKSTHDSQTFVIPLILNSMGLNRVGSFICRFFPINTCIAFDPWLGVCG